MREPGHGCDDHDNDDRHTAIVALHLRGIDIFLDTPTRASSGRFHAAAIEEHDSDKHRNKGVAWVPQEQDEKEHEKNNRHRTRVNGKSIANTGASTAYHWH